MANLDVATAFLLAPRRESERQLLVMKPPKVLVDAGICGSDELWQIPACNVWTHFFAVGLGALSKLGSVQASMEFGGSWISADPNA